jgi:hypothetical protein
MMRIANITATSIIARSAPSPSSPAPSARRYAAVGLDRSVRPSKIADVPMMPSFSMYANPNPPSQKSLTQNV